MIEIIKELNIEVSNPNVFQAVVAKQYDMNTRFIKATFVNDGNKIYIDHTANVKVVINALRQDGESKGFDGVVNDDGTVTVPLHSWMLQLAGTVSCDISVIDLEADDNKKLTTTGFTLVVEKSAWDGDGMTSDPQYNLLIELLNTCSTAGEVAEEALQKSNEANSKYDACVEATQAANNAADVYTAMVENDGVRNIVEHNGNVPIDFWVGTQAEYEAITEKDQSRLYIISDDDIGETLQTLQTGLNEVTEKTNKNDATLQILEPWAAGTDATVSACQGEIEELQINLSQNATYTKLLGSDHALAYGGTFKIEGLKNKYLIDALRNCKTALVRVAGQSVLCSAAQATSYQTQNDDIWYISGCAPYTRIVSQRVGHIDLIVVALAIVFDDIKNPTEATITNFSQIKNITGGNIVGKDTDVAGANVHNILLLNASNFYYE